MRWFSLLFLLASCGQKKESKPPPQEPPVIKEDPIVKKTDPVKPDPKEPELTFLSTVVSIVDADCALSGCHANSQIFKSEEAFLQSTSISRIENGSMPPTLSPRYNQWTDDKRDIILEWYRLKQ